MAKNKLKKFNQLKIFSNVIEPSLKDLEDGYNLKGKWKKNFFKNNNPIVLELGCGKGEYSIGLSKRYTDKNFIGIDIKGARIWKGANDAIKEKKILEKIILCDVQKEIYPNLETAFLNLLHNSGYPEIKFEKKIDFEKLYNQRFN